jgi:hypothetical protein
MFFWMIPEQSELDALMACLSANVANYWNESYRREYVAAKAMRCLGLAYSE